MDYRWGVDLGGTKIEGVVLPKDSIDPVCRIRISTEAHDGYEHILDRIRVLVDELRARSGASPAAIGFGTPGTADPTTGRMRGCNTTCLNGRALPRDLEAALGVPVVVANDANCFALAEARLGSARGFPTVFGVILGTGVGGGLVVRGAALAGAHGIAGEWGHNLLEPDGEACYCGRRGCVETVLSGPALERWYERRTGVRLPLREIAARADLDPSASATIERLIEMTGKALGVVVNILDPHAIVLGGGVGNVAQLYSSLHESVAPYVFTSEFRTPILRPTLGDSAGVFGAAMLTADQSVSPMR